MPDIDINVSGNSNIEVELENISAQSPEIDLQTDARVLESIGTTPLYGPRGPNGQDGFSPIANVEKSEGIATITITDKNGTTTATISDGVDGTDGEDGEAATITVGTVTTGNAGTDASVTNSGTTSEAVFDFVIPRGDKGDTGNTGATGADGYSPTATVTKSGNTATITITDKNGTTTANVYDGAAGVSDVKVNNTSVVTSGVANIDLSGYAETSNLATVATSGSYSDLINTPTIPDALSDITVVAGSNISISGDTISATDTTYLTFVGADSITGGTSGLVPSPSAGDEDKYLCGGGSFEQIDYAQIGNTPTIPTVNNSTITITQGGVTKGSFTLNQASGDTIALDAGGGGTVDQIFDGTSINAQSGVAIQNELTARIDGQWVQKIQNVTTTTAKGSYSYTIPSTVIPADGYAYEVLLNLRVYSSNSSNAAQVFVWTDAISKLGNTAMDGQGVAGGYSRQTANTFILPVGTGTRKIWWSIEDYAASQLSLNIWGYRRIGTNT